MGVLSKEKSGVSSSLALDSLADGEVVLYLIFSGSSCWYGDSRWVLIGLLSVLDQGYILFLGNRGLRRLPVSRWDLLDVEHQAYFLPLLLAGWECDWLCCSCMVFICCHEQVLLQGLTEMVGAWNLEIFASFVDLIVAPHLLNQYVSHKDACLFLPCGT